MLLEYGVYSLLISLTSHILVLESNIGILRASIQVGISILYYYFMHRFIIHGLPSTFLNIHLYNHHDKQLHVHRNLELFIDFIAELSWCLPLLVLQYVSGVWIVSPSILVFVFLLITISHILNYSILGSQIHYKHHQDSTKNFGPDVMDHLFGTNSEKEREDVLQHVSSLVMSCIVVHFSKVYFQWKD
jgi:hypothetical protein